MSCSKFIPLLLILLSVSCLRDPEVEKNEPDAPTVKPLSNGMTRIKVGVIVSEIVPEAEYGISIQSEDDSPPDRTFKNEELDNNNSFTWEWDGLKPGTTYFIQSYVYDKYNKRGRKYSNSVPVTTDRTSKATLSVVFYHKGEGILSAVIENDGGRELVDWGFAAGVTSELKELRKKERHSGQLVGEGVITLSISEFKIDEPSFFIAYVEDEEGCIAYSPSPKYLRLNDIYNLSIAPENDDEDTSIQVGETLQLRTVLSPVVDLPFVWGSENVTVASVDKDGVVTGVSAGKCTIWVRYRDLEAKCVVTVNPAPDSIVSFGESEREVHVGDNFTLKDMVSSSTATLHYE